MDEGERKGIEGIVIYLVVNYEQKKVPQTNCMLLSCPFHLVHRLPLSLDRNSNSARIIN